MRSSLSFVFVASFVLAFCECVASGTDGSSSRRLSAPQLRRQSSSGSAQTKPAARVETTAAKDAKTENAELEDRFSAVEPKSSSQPVVRVKGKGMGDTKEAALKDAYRDAVDRAVGTFVDSEVVMKNDDVIKEQVLTQSNAYIQKYECKTIEIRNGQTYVEIVASVKKADLTRKLTEVMPTQTTQLGSVNQNLHAEIVSSMKMNDDAVTLVKNELTNLSPLSQMMKVSLAVAKPKIEKTEDAEIVRLHYPLLVQVDRERYFQQFVPRISRIFDQVKLAPTKRIDLTTDRALQKAYQAALKQEYGDMVGFQSLSDKQPDDGQESPLQEFGLAWRERYVDVLFLGGTILGKSCILSGLGWWYSRKFGDEVWKNYADVYRPLKRDFITRRGNDNRLSAIPEDCKFVVGVIEGSRAKDSVFYGRLYKLPYDCIREIVKWQCAKTYGKKYEYSYDSTSPQVSFEMSFKDSKGDEVAGTTVRFRNDDIMNFASALLVDPEDGDGSPKHGGMRLWLVSPLVGGFARGYVKWMSIDVAKDDVMKIDSVSFTPEE